MIRLDVLRVMKLKAISEPYAFLKAHGFTHHTAYRLTKSKPLSVSFTHLEKLCRILHCEPYDLFAYTPDKNTALPKNDHLAFLQKSDDRIVDVNAIMKGLSPRQMVDLGNELAQRYSTAS